MSMEAATDAIATERARQQAAAYRRADPAFARWAAGYGVIEHVDETQVRIYELAVRLRGRDARAADRLLRDLAAADRVASAAMWLVVHATYARNVRLDGCSLDAADFKPHPD